MLVATVVLIGCALPPKSAGEGQASAGSGGMSTGPGTVTAPGNPDGPGMTSSAMPGADETTAAAPGVCREAIDCIVECATGLVVDDDPRPDLTCFLGCEEALSVDEALHLFELTECVTDLCIDAGVCDVLVATGTDTDGGASGTGTGMGTDTGSSGGTGDDNRCLDCVLANLSDPEPLGCVGFAQACI